MSDSLQPHGLQHTRCPCLSLSPGFCPSSFPLNWWCFPTISPFAFNFSQHQGLFQWVGTSHQSIGQSIGTSASTLVLPVNIQNWFPLGLTSLISLLSKGLSRVFLSTPVWNHQFFSAQPFLWSNSHICIWLLEKSSFWLYGPLSAFILIMLQPYLSSHPLTHFCPSHINSPTNIFTDEIIKEKCFPCIFRSHILYLSG